MRRTKEIEKLSASGAAVTFPVYNQPFERYKHQLLELVCENFQLDNDARRSFDFVESGRLSGMFSWEEDEIVASIGPEEDAANETRVFIKICYWIDPRKSLLAEFERVTAERKQFNTNRVIIAKAVIGLGGRVR